MPEEKKKRGRPSKKEIAQREAEKLKADVKIPLSKQRMPKLADHQKMNIMEVGEAQRYSAIFLQQSGIADPHPEDSPQCAEKRMLFVEYMKSCALNDIVPSNLGCLSALHTTSERYARTVAGQFDKDLTELYTQINTVLAAIREQLGMKSKINPATLIFWAKNFDGMKDEQDVIIGVKDQFGTLPDGQKLAAEYSNLPEK